MLTSSERLRVLSRLFTRATLSGLSKTGDWETALKFLSQHGLLQASEMQPLSLLFENAWRELRLKYRNEYVYKNEVANRLIFGLHSPRKAALYLEMPVGRSIVDVAVFNGTSTAYEIKTEFDTARRLHTQTLDYVKAFEKVFVVTTPGSAKEYARLVPESVGILTLTRRGSLSLFRAATPNRADLDARTLFRCLRRDEYLDILTPLDQCLQHLPNGIIAARSMSLFSELDLDTIHDSYVNALRRRKLRDDAPTFLKQLPPSLRAIGCGTPLSRLQRSNVLKALKSQIAFQLI